MGIIRKRFRIVNCKLHSVDRRHETRPHDMHWFKAAQTCQRNPKDPLMQG
jgi:hypothetical protein